MVGQLVERIRQKDQRAMSQLYQMYVEELSSVCYRYVPDDNDAKDVLQNSFVKIFTSLSTFEYRDEPSFRGWMLKVVGTRPSTSSENARSYCLQSYTRPMFSKVQTKSLFLIVSLQMSCTN